MTDNQGRPREDTRGYNSEGRNLIPAMPHAGGRQPPQHRPVSLASRDRGGREYDRGLQRGYSVDERNHDRSGDRPRHREAQDRPRRGEDRDYYRDRRSSDAYYQDQRHHGNERGRSRDRWEPRLRGRDSPEFSRRDDGLSRDRQDHRYGDRRFPEENNSRDKIENSDWRCSECDLWNHPRDRQCDRCRAPKPNGIPPPQKVEWPPKFEGNGSSFVLDSRSGMFYEAKSDFFYDPKTKLYYGNAKSTYFRYDETKNPPFEEVAKMPSAADSENAQPAADNPINKPSIAINLKTKKLKKNKKRDSSGQPVSVSASAQHTTPKSQRQNEANIEKWIKREQEKQEGSLSDITTHSSGAPSEAPVIRTVKGEPICALCRRKFPTVEKLRLHETSSQMHRTNMEQAMAKRSASSSSATEYQDRAKRRRELHEMTDVPIIPASSSSSAFSMPSAGVAPVEAALPEPPKDDLLSPSNIGNQMLAKMGWKEGSSLGKNGANDEAANAIRKDWDRIEYKAAGK